MSRLEKIKLEVFTDDRGVLVPLELKDFIDWEVKRIYFLPVLKGERGAHAVRGEKKIYICEKGTMEASFHDGKAWVDFELNGSGEAVVMEGFYYRKFFNFSDDAVLLAVSSLNYNRDDYVFDLDEFIKEANK
ncbi:FdtA/QdtA family cupin domain-containing protein [Patescibacteria group bacterium]|nr:FdtA/QdtA family cupin domain-containing protein [Patescibacteria group bacterium]